MKFGYAKLPRFSEECGTIMSNEKIMIDEAKTQAAAEVSEDVIEQKTELSEEELMDFYLENQDAIDLMGGLEMFESLMALDEEQFAILKYLKIFIF